MPFVVGSVSTVMVKEFCAVALRQMPENKKTNTNLISVFFKKEGTVDRKSRGASFGTAVLLLLKLKEYRLKVLSIQNVIKLY